MQSAESDRLFMDAEPEDVDGFSKVMLEVVFGSERMWRWARLDTEFAPIVDKLVSYLKQHLWSWAMHMCPYNRRKPRLV
jgi:hypothetical protein